VSFLLRNMMRRYLKPEGGEGGSGGGSQPPAAAAAPAAAQTFSAEYVRELREENKSWRQKHQDATTEAGNHKTAAEKAAKDAEDRITAATTAANERVIRAELKAVALKAGMVDLDGLKLADLSAVKLNDQGEVEGADALIEALKTAKPYLFGTAQHSSTPATPPAAKPPAAKKATEMTDAEYAAARKAIK